MQANNKSGVYNRLSVANIALVVGVILLERFPGERWWPTLLLIYLPQLILTIPSILLAAYFLKRKQWLQTALAIAALLVALTMLVGMPLPHAQSQKRAQLRIVSWNVHFGHGGPAVAELARKTWPDIICLQEANPWAEKDLDKLLSLPIFRGWHSKTCGELVILSRFPLKWLRTTHSALWVSADLGGQKIVIVNAHFAQPYKPFFSPISNLPDIYSIERFRRLQMRQIIENLPTDKPVVVCGDFNTPPNTMIYRTFASNLTDSFQHTGKGMGLSYPRQFPLTRIDHIFVGSGAAPLRCFQPEIKASDHRPLCADVALNLRY